jgi:hypothetical protein
MMTKPLLAILLLFTVSLRGYSANPDDAAWLIYDVSYGDYFLLRVDMKTSRTGRANIAGGNRYAGRRFTGHDSRFGVSMLSGNMSINKGGAEPFMVGIINAGGDEYSGEFFNEDGSSAGRFVGALQGFTTHQMDLFQLCKEGKYDDFICVNRGRYQMCGLGSYDAKSTFFTEKNCLDEIGDEPPTAPTPLTQTPNSASPRYSDDPTGTWLFYDERYKEHVLGRLVATNFEDRKPDEPIEGTFVFSGVYYGWDEGEGFFAPKQLYFGRRYLGNSALSVDKRDRFYISLDGQEIMFRHGYQMSFFGFADFNGGKMRGGFQPGKRKSIQTGRIRNFDDLGPGAWTAEKKSDDPNFDFPVYQYCSGKRGSDDPAWHGCADVSAVRADGASRPLCEGGYRQSSITFLEKDKCKRLQKARCQREGQAPKGACRNAIAN